MKDFNDILNEWESGKHQKQDTDTQKKKRKIDTKDDWTGLLDSYLPDKKDLALKNKTVGKKTGVEKRGGKKIKNLDFQDNLDLHGLYKEDALFEVRTFIVNSCRHDLKKVLIIHGKGFHSEKDAVLRPAVRELLSHMSEVSDFGMAERRHGGSGATWVLLKNQRSL